MIKLSIIIPIFNEEGNINLLYDRVKKVAEGISPSHEMVFINDGSRDRSIELIKQLSQKDASVKFINFARNFGHQIAVSAGLDHCSGERIVIIDADLQDPPELIVDMNNKMNEGFEVVYAKRRSREGEGFFKKWTAKWFYRTLKKITSVNIPVDTGDFRIMDRKIVEVLKKMPEQHKFLRGQISWVGFNQTYIEYDRAERNSGETGYTYRKMIRFALDGITAFSTTPLKFATALGFFVSIAAFVVSLYVLFAKFVKNDTVPGWTSLMLVVLFLGGVQLICIGIIGEYISRLSTDVKQRPLYVIREKNI